MSLVIASQLEGEFNERLRAHPSRPTVITPAEETPWEAAAEADIMLIRPTPIWRGNRHIEPPARWPGKLQWVFSASVGIDYYPRWLFDAPTVSCGRGVASEEIAEYVLSAILSHTKDLDSVRARSLADWKHAPLGRVRGSTVGIVGLGAIGSEVAKLALAFGANVTGVRRRTLGSAVPGVQLLSLQEVVATADHLVIAVPSTESTRGLFDAELLRHAKPNLHLINIARGAVIDQSALIEALNAERIGFATLDVTDPEPLPAAHPLWTHPRVRLTPHVSSNYLAVRHVLYDKVSANFDRFLRGEPLHDVVDKAEGY
ncbi:MAG: D-isomer specific 2-hydroxyacid dehydrogenase family protein [Polyangiales bacterium]